MHDRACSCPRLRCEPDEHAMIGPQVVCVACVWHMLQVPDKRFLLSGAGKALVCWCTWNHDHTLYSFYFFCLMCEWAKFAHRKVELSFLKRLSTDLERATFCVQRGCRGHSGCTLLHGPCACRVHYCLCLKYKIRFFRTMQTVCKHTEQPSCMTACL